jgi:hypothetical protein
VTDRLEIQALKKDYVARRLKGAGNIAYWSNRDEAQITEYIWDKSADDIMAAKAIVAIDLSVKSTSVSSDVIVKMNPTDLNFKFLLTEKVLDRAGDMVEPPGVDWSDYLKNRVVLPSHDSSQWPIASSSPPYLSNGKIFAVAQFPQPGISAPATQAAAAIRNGLLNACSIGFIPRSWSFSKDPARPFGVDFKTISLIEWSICSVPCLPTALLIGPVSGDAGKTVDSHNARERRLAEVRSLREQTSRESKKSEVTTREQRIAEAARLRRLAYSK